MDKKGGLLAPKRPRVTMKKRIGFLDLPGEIRNQIYDYYFQQGFKCEFVEKGAKLGYTQRECLKFLSHNRKAGGVYAQYQRRPMPVAEVRFSRVLGMYTEPLKVWIREHEFLKATARPAT